MILAIVLATFVFFEVLVSLFGSGKHLSGSVVIIEYHKRPGNKDKVQRVFWKFRG